MSTIQEINAVARKVADFIIGEARGSGEPVVFVTGNSYFPPMRSFASMDDLWHESESAFYAAVELVETLLSDADVYLDSPEYYNCLYAVDMKRFEFKDYYDPQNSNTDNINDEWQPIDPAVRAAAALSNSALLEAASNAQEMNEDPA